MIRSQFNKPNKNCKLLVSKNGRINFSTVTAKIHPSNVLKKSCMEKGRNHKKKDFSSNPSQTKSNLDLYEINDRPR
jgi:hypothetical protein